MIKDEENGMINCLSNIKLILNEYGLSYSFKQSEV